MNFADRLLYSLIGLDGLTLALDICDSHWSAGRVVRLVGPDRPGEILRVGGAQTLQVGGL